MPSFNPLFTSHCAAMYVIFISKVTPSIHSYATRGRSILISRKLFELKVGDEHVHKRYACYILTRVCTCCEL